MAMGTRKHREIAKAPKYQEMCKFTQELLLEVTQPQPKTATAKDIQKPHVELKNYSNVLVANLGKYSAKTDEDVKHSTLTEFVENLGFAYMVGLPVSEDNETQWEDVAESRRFQEQFGRLADVYVKYDELLSNEAVTQFAFSGMGCHKMKKIGINYYDRERVAKRDDRNHNNDIPGKAKYMSDFSFLSIFEVREGYEHYGAAAYFDEDYKLMGIYCNEYDEYMEAVEDGVANEKWNHFKWIYKTSVFCAVTLMDHLWRVHHTESQALYECSIQSLSVNHPLRHFLKPFAFRAANINYKAINLLSCENGVAQRLWAFPFSQLVRVFNYCTMTYKFQPLPDYVDASMRDEDAADDSHFPVLKDSQQFWDTMREFVAAYMKVYYTDDIEFAKQLRFGEIKDFAGNLEKHLGLKHGHINTLDRFVDVLTQLICNGTGMHEVVGQTSDYLQQADWVGTKLVKGYSISTVQSYGQLLALSGFTGQLQPTIEEDWLHLFNHDDNYEQVEKVYKEFQASLKQLRRDIEARNLTRKYPMEFFNPKHCKTSVSI